MTGAGSHRKGRTWQTAVRQFWEASPWAVVEAGGAGIESTDLILLCAPVVSIEAKNHKAMDLAGWLDQAIRQAPSGAVPIVQHKRRGKGDVGDSYVTLRAADFARLLGGAA